MVAGLFHFVGSVAPGGVRSGVAAPHSRSHRLQLTFDTVIASVAKQSRARVRKVGAPALGCFVAPLLAMTEHERESASAGLASGVAAPRSEEHTSELQSLMRSSYAVFCL